jgi:hypothetical protein
LKIYPVPATGNSVHFAFTFSNDTYCIIKLKTEKGESFDVWKGAVIKGDNDVILDISDFTSGTYSIIIYDKNNNKRIMGSKFNIIR